MSNTQTQLEEQQGVIKKLREELKALKAREQDLLAARRSGAQGEADRYDLVTLPNGDIVRVYPHDPPGTKRERPDTIQAGAEPTKHQTAATQAALEAAVGELMALKQSGA